MKKVDGRTWLTVREYMKLKNISRSTVARMTKRGDVIFKRDKSDPYKKILIRYDGYISTCPMCNDIKKT